MSVVSADNTTATIRLERKHPLAIRWMHWVNFPVLFTMIWSGILIYWNDSDRAYQHPQAIYRIGIGKLTLLPVSRLALDAYRWYKLRRASIRAPAENSAPAPPTSANTTVGFSGESVQPVGKFAGPAGSAR